MQNKLRITRRKTAAAKLLYKTCNAHRYQRLFQYERPVKSPGTDFSSKICSKPLDRGEGARIYIRTGLEGKQGLGCLTVSQLEYLWVISGHLQLQWGENVCVCVCGRHSVCESMRDGSVPLCCTSAGSAHFRSPSSPWMVFLMRSRRVVCHWSRREMESNSLTWVTETES